MLPNTDTGLSSKRIRKPAASREYPGHDLSLTSTTPSPARKKVQRRSSTKSAASAVTPQSSQSPRAPSQTTSIEKIHIPSKMEVSKPIKSEAPKPIARLKLFGFKQPLPAVQISPELPITKDATPPPQLPPQSLLSVSPIQPSIHSSQETPASDSNSSSKRQRKAPPSKEYPGHELSLSSATPSPTRSRGPRKTSVKSQASTATVLSSQSPIAPSYTTAKETIPVSVKPEAPKPVARLKLSVMNRPLPPVQTSPEPPIQNQALPSRLSIPTASSIQPSTFPAAEISQSPANDLNLGSRRQRKAPPSKEYPGHNESLNPPKKKRARTFKAPNISIPSTPGPYSAALQTPTSVQAFLNQLKSTGNFPSASSLSIGSVPNTPPITVNTRTRKSSDLPAQLAAYLPERPHRSSTKNMWEYAPSLVSRDVKKNLGLTSPSQFHHRPFDYSSPSPSKALKIAKSEISSPTKSIESYSESFELDYEHSVDTDLIDYGEDAIEYLKNLHPNLRNSFRNLEDDYEKEYFLREILMDDVTVNDANHQNDEVDIDDVINEEKPQKNYSFTSSVAAQAKAIIELLPNSNRLTCDEIKLYPQNEESETSFMGVLEILCEVIKKQCCMELAVTSHQEPLASYYVYSLQNATWLRGKMLIHFTYELIKAHEWLLANLEETQLLSYLILLKFLNAAGTTMGNILVAKSSPDFQAPNEQVSQVLNDKLRDPFSRMIINLGRQLKHDNVYLLLIVPGISVLNAMMTAVYHGHEQIYGGLTNMGCTVEKMILNEDKKLWPNEDELTITNVCDLTIEFIKQKIVETVNRRPNDRLFIASWGVTCLLVHEAILDIDGVSGIIDLAMPIQSTIGPRGVVGDKILLTYCPTLCVVGEDSGDLEDTAAMLERFNISNGLCVVGKADSSLIVQPNILIKYGITQACIARMIVQNIMDFVDRVADDTVNGIHTKHLELPYPWVLTEDINEHVMRSDEAYGLGDDFIEDEDETIVVPSTSAFLEPPPPPLIFENGNVKPSIIAPSHDHNDVIDEFLDIESTDTPDDGLPTQYVYENETAYDEIEIENEMAAAAIADASNEDEPEVTRPNQHVEENDEYDEEIDVESLMAAAAIAEMADDDGGYGG